MKILLLHDKEINQEMVTLICDSLAKIEIPYWAMEFSWNNVPKLISTINSVRPTLVLNGLSGHLGRDGKLQGLLEGLGVLYSHSDQLSTALANHRSKSRIMFDISEIPIPTWSIAQIDTLKFGSPVAYPVVMKSIVKNDKHTSFLVHSQNEMDQLIGSWKGDEEVIVEQYINGRELFVMCIDGVAFGVQECLTHNEFNNIQSESDLLNISTPFFHNESEKDLLYQYAERAHCVLGCSGITISHFIQSQGVFYILSVDTNPKLAESSVLAKITSSLGWPYEEVVNALIYSSKGLKDVEKEKRKDKNDIPFSALLL